MASSGGMPWAIALKLSSLAWSGSPSIMACFISWKSSSCMKASHRPGMSRGAWQIPDAYDTDLAAVDVRWRRTLCLPPIRAAKYKETKDPGANINDKCEAGLCPHTKTSCSVLIRLYGFHLPLEFTNDCQTCSILGVNSGVSFSPSRYKNKILSGNNCLQRRSQSTGVSLFPPKRINFTGAGIFSSNHTCSLMTDFSAEAGPS